MKVIRVLEYESDNLPALKRQLERNGVHRIHEFQTGMNIRDVKGGFNIEVPSRITIRELVLGRYTKLSQRVKIAWRILVGDYEDPEVVL